MKDKKRYTVTLDKNIVEEVKKHQEEIGGKFAPLVNILLIKWLKENKRK